MNKLLGKAQRWGVVAALSKVLLSTEQLHSAFPHDKGFIFLLDRLISSFITLK
jgi:hypothetical protein